MNRSVLVVEDYADLRSAIVSSLERQDYACEAVTNSEDAVLKLRDHNHDYSAILISPKVPIADDPVMHYLVEHRPDDVRKVIVMSDPATATGECSLLEKPFTNDEMFAKITERL